MMDGRLSILAYTRDEAYVMKVSLIPHWPISDNGAALSLAQ
jgi:hypothetical protein